MKVKILEIFLCITIIIIFGCKDAPPKFSITDANTEANLDDFPALKKLSDYGKFKLPLKSMEPAECVFYYDLNSSLFTDYAHKKRFIYLPDGKTMKFHKDHAFDFPEGSHIFKFFYYPRDFNKSNEDLRIIETRVLIKGSDQWQALTYIWNDEQTDAFLSLAGETKNVEWVDENGSINNINYSVPGILVCKSCHEFNGEIEPIGPTARHLNKFHSLYPSKNQLTMFQENKKLTDLPDITTVSKIANWENETVDLNERSRAYLDINCAHCHRKEGPAKNSGLYLLAFEQNSYALGIKKPPVAAGRGSGNLKYGIEPGSPQASILVYRMMSLEPGIMMPEAGRRTMHKEGVDLISEWIKNMD